MINSAVFRAKDNSDLYIYQLNEAGQVLQINNNALNLFGFTNANEIINMTFLDSVYHDVYPDIAAKIDRNNKKAILQGTPSFFEEKINNANTHKTFFCKSYKIPALEFGYSKNNIVAISYSVKQKELSDEEFDIIALKNLLLQLDGHIYWQNLEGIILGCNQAQANSLGYTVPEEVIGKHPRELVPLNEAIELEKILKEIITTKNAITIEEKITFKQGMRYMLSHKIPLFRDSNDVIGILGVSLDITDQKQVEKLKAEKIEIENKARYLRAAAGNIAHDLRTPLASIKLANNGIELLLPQLLFAYDKAVEHDLVSNKIAPHKINALRDVTKRTKREIDYSNNYIDMILGNLKYENIDNSEYALFSINEVITTALNDYPFAKNERSLVNWDYTNDFNFWGNELYLRNVIYNLIKNSLYYIKQQNKGEIYIWLEKAEQCVLHFKDTAKGASEEILEKIFEPYYSTRDGGTGLGLAFCKSIITSFKGEIKVSSEVDRYIHFKLIFPTV